MRSTALLIEKMKRLGASSGSHTSAAPVSVEAQPPSIMAAMATASKSLMSSIDRTLAATFLSRQKMSEFEDELYEKGFGEFENVEQGHVPRSSET